VSVKDQTAGKNNLERHATDWIARAKRSAARWAFRNLPTILGSDLEAAAGEFKPAPSFHFFSSDLLEIPPTLNDDLLDLYGRAGQAVANRFAFFNSLQVFDKEIDWEPAQSACWRAELHAFDFALDLACTYRISREQVYARHLRYLMAHWIACNPPETGTGWQVEILARRVRNWMLAADLARNDWQQDTEFATVVSKSLALQVAFLASQVDSLTSLRAKLHASRAFLCAGIFFSGNKAQELSGLGRGILLKALELSHENSWPIDRLATAQALMDWCLHSDARDESSLLGTKLREALLALEDILAPDGSLPLLGPAARTAQDELEDLAALAAVKLDSQKWKSQAGKFGILPYLYLGEAENRHFIAIPEDQWIPQDSVGSGGQALRLVGSGKSGAVLSARFPTREEHQDFSSYELSINGLRVVVDSGGFSPEEKTYFPTARAHNLLFINGHQPTWQNVAASTQVDFRTDNNGGRLRLSDPGFSFMGIQHERVWFRLQDDAWLILDRLVGHAADRCNNLVRFYPTFELAEAGDRFVAKSRAASFSVIPVGLTKPQGSITRGDDGQFPGWYSPEYGVKFAANVLNLEWTSIELPWVGGILIASGDDVCLSEVEVLPMEGLVRFKLSGRSYDLRLS
jgi:hypothetical protein